MPVYCPFCGAGVSTTAPTCAVCGVANPAAKINATLDLGTSPEDFLPDEVLRTLGSAPSDRRPPPLTSQPCAACGAKLDLGAKFCWSCGGAVGLKVRARPGPPRERVVPMARPEPAPEPAAASEPASTPAPELEPEPRPKPAPVPVLAPMSGPEPERPRRPRRHIALADLDEEVGDDLPPPPRHHDPMDYLDAQLGLKAPGTDPAPPKPPAWRGRYLALADEARDAPPDDAGAPAPAPRDPFTPQPSAAPAWATPAAMGFALFALGIAVLVHLFAPNAIPGYSAAELDMKVQLRAIEWLLAGVLIALAGLLVKR